MSWWTFLTSLFSNCFYPPTRFGQTISAPPEEELKFLISLSARLEGQKITVPIDSLVGRLKKPNPQGTVFLASKPLPGGKSQGEMECRRVLKKIYKRPFPSVRPKFLRNPKTGKNLELDCFNCDLAIACEYNGEQHYRFPNKFHKRKEAFLSSLQRDLYKIKRCQELGIYLIIVPYTIPIEDIERFILEHLPEN